MTDDDDSTTPPRPIPIADVRSSPILRLLDREVTDEDRALAERLGRIGGDHRLLAARLVRALEAEKQTSGEALAEQLGRALAEHDKRLDAVVDDVRDIKTGVRWGKALGGFALGVAISVGGFVANRMLSGEELKGEYRVRLDHLEKSVEWLIRAPKDKP